MMSEDKERECAALVDKFRENVADVLQPHHDDHYLMHWLRARNFDLNKSESMLRAHIAWRAQVGADKVLEWTPPEVLTKFYPGGLVGYDKDDRPLWIETVGRIDIKGIMLSAKKSEMIRYKIYHCELIQKVLQAQHEKLNRHVEGLVIILDLEHLGMKHLWKPALGFYSDMLKIFEANYPEALYKCFVVNAPSIFPLVYSLLKPFLSEDTKRKIVVLGGGWKQHLLKHIDSDQLPVHWGGTARDADGDEYCRSKFPLGGEVDRSYYIQDDMDWGLSTQVTVPTRSSLKIPVTVTEVGSLLRWQFQTESKDVGFSINHTLPDGTHVNIVPLARHNCNMIPEDGSIVCRDTGTYTVVFDNSFSWISKKKLSYQLDVLPPASSQDVSDIQSPPSPNGIVTNGSAPVTPPFDRHELDATSNGIVTNGSASMTPTSDRYELDATSNGIVTNGSASVTPPSDRHELDATSNGIVTNGSASMIPCSELDAMSNGVSGQQVLCE